MTESTDTLTLLQLPTTQGTSDKPKVEFGTWLNQIRKAVDGNLAMDVPCGSCTGCCKAGYFIRVHTSETQAIASIPEGLLFPAPGEPDVKVMGFDEQGHCPMLVDNQCSIYSTRPQTCRTYDCRVFSASGISPGRSTVDEPARTWQFSHEGVDAQQQHRALITAAAFLNDNLDDIPELGDNPLQLALAALHCQPLFATQSLPASGEMLQKVRHRLQPD